MSARKPKLAAGVGRARCISTDRLISYQSDSYDAAKPATGFRSWRVGTHEGDRFDELAIRLSREQCIHLETMSDLSMFVDLAGVCFWLFKIDGAWVLKGPETRTGALTPGFDGADDPERKRVVALVKKRCAELRRRRREVARKR